MRYLVFCFLVLSSPIHALSCMRIDAATLYSQADASEKRYIAVLGRLDFPKSAMREPAEKDGIKESYSFPATFTGKTLDSRGLKRDFEADVTVNINCVAHWCGSASTEVDYLAALEMTETGYTFDADACGGLALINPPKSEVRAFERCAKGGECTAPY